MRVLRWKGLQERNGEGERNDKAKGSYMVEDSLCSTSILKDFFPCTC